LWGLAHDGEAGVTQAIELLRAELMAAMALSGTANLEQITRSHLARRGADGRMAKL
jgi:(S)-2-hydroxy-acid oxidase